MYRYLIFQNIIAPYKTLLFNSLARVLGRTFLVVYLAETAGNREWKVARDEIAFPYDVLAPGREEDATSLKTAAAAYRSLEYHNPEVVVVGGYNYLACWAALLWAKRRKRRAVIIIESHYLDRPRRRAQEAIKRIFVSRFDAALVDGTRHREYAMSLGLPQEKIFIKNGTGPVDLDFYQSNMARFRPDKERHCRDLGLPPRNFLYVGRFSAEKNIMLLLRAYRKFREGGTARWGLILLGNGPQREEINRFIRDHSLQDVVLPGFKQKEEVPFYYSVSDVLALPSLSEPWGLVVDEAMASGLAVLVSNRCGCYPDLLRDGVNGYSFDPGDCEDLACRMREIASGDADVDAMGRASLEIIRNYTPEIVSEMYARVLRLVGRDGP
jgi:glycosyltransferase involved in cell wall biosynthesis